jgi:hypothetical protein
MSIITCETLDVDDRKISMCERVRGSVGPVWQRHSICGLEGWQMGWQSLRSGPALAAKLQQETAATNARPGGSQCAYPRQSSTNGAQRGPLRHFASKGLGFDPSNGFRRHRSCQSGRSASLGFSLIRDRSGLRGFASLATRA